MTINGKIETYIIDIIKQLKNAGFETYLVGGAVRDILLNIHPKDYDISTKATPGQIRKIFNHKNARIIGRRFKIVHLYYKGHKYIEISTFRKAPDSNNPDRETQIIIRDNIYGTSYEDAWRRDFTVNSIFYDPINNEYKDFTENGLSDLKEGIVRSIGDPVIRFSEDPVRILRALKLVAQYGFILTDEVKHAIFNTIEQITFCSNSRLLLELEKIFRKPYSFETLKVFKNYNFLTHYLPYINKKWDTDACFLSLKLLRDYNFYCINTNSVSHYTTSLVLISLPFINYELADDEKNIFWELYPGIEKDIQHIINKIFSPYVLSGYRSNGIISSILLLQKMYYKYKVTKTRLNPFYKSTKDVLRIINQNFWHNNQLIEFWENQIPKKRNRKKSGYLRNKRS